MRKTVIVRDSSPWKSWSENNDSHNGGALSAEPAGPGTEQRGTAEESPVESGGGEEPEKDSEDRNKQAYLL